jgi:iron complex outermembrane receptor protein
MTIARTLSAVLALSASPLAAAYAQSAAAPAAAPAAAADDTAKLDDIVVTARKRTERLQDVPVAISALSGDTLRQRGTIDIRSVATISPGVFYQAGDRRTPTLYIRGIGTRSFTDEADPSVGTFIDGVYIARFNSTLQDLFDVERVEVLKGPQGTLFGRNTIGGALNIITRSPTDQFHAMIDLSHSWNQNFGGTGNSASALISGPIAGDTLLGQISGSYNQADGFTKIVNTGKLANGGRNATVRGKLIYKPADTLKLSLIGDYYKTHDQLGVERSNDVGGARSTILLARPGAVSPVDPDPYKVTATPGITTPTRNGGGVSLTGEFDGGGVTVTSITAYRKSNLNSPIDFDGTSLDLWLVTTNSHQDQFSQELRLASTPGGPLTFGDRVKWTAGAYYFSENVHQVYSYHYGFDSSLVALAPPAGTGGTPIDWSNTEDVAVKSYALFGQATINLAKGLSLDLGGRFTEDKKTYLSQAVTSAPGIYRANFIQPAANSWRAFDPTAILSYKISPTTLAYASFSRGFKSGAYQLAPATPLLATQVARPERITAYQAGIKSDLLDGRLRINVAGFYYKYDNIQVQQTLLLPGQTTTISLLSNGAKSTLKGFEVDGQFVFNRILRAQYGFSYLSAKYDQYNSTPTLSYSGNDLPYAPHETANFALVADVPMGFGNLNLRGGAQYTGAYFWAPGNQNAGVREPSHIIADLSADLRFSHYHVGLFVNNLTGERTRVAVTDINPTRLLEVWGNRRVVGVRVGADW